MIHQYTLDHLMPRLAAARHVAPAEPDTPAEETTFGAFLIEVVSNTGRGVAVELRLKRDTVEVWKGDHLCGVFVRDALRAWLDEPDPRRLPIVIDEVAFSIDRLVDRSGRVAITLPDVVTWTIDPHTLAKLREQL